MKIFCSLWSPLSKKHKISLSYFQMCLMARLKALGILRWNLGSDIKLHDPLLADFEFAAHFEQLWRLISRKVVHGGA